jgi:hypothetical protein
VDSPYVSTTTNLTNLSTSHAVDTFYNIDIPSIVMQTCLTVSTLGDMKILSNVIDQNVNAYVEFYWAELDPKVIASSRQFWIHLPSPNFGDRYVDVFDITGGLFVFRHDFFWGVPLTTSTSTPEFVLYPTPQSIFGPSLNALEIYGETNNIALTSTKLDGKYSTSPKLIWCRC